jgi:hypothetical protein
MSDETITTKEVEILEKLNELPLETDEDYLSLAEVFGEDFEEELDMENMCRNCQNVEAAPETDLCFGCLALENSGMPPVEQKAASLPPTDGVHQHDQIEGDKEPKRDEEDDQAPDWINPKDEEFHEL